MPIIVPMRVALHVVTAGHHEDPALQAHHIDVRAIEPRENRPGDHLVDGAERRLAAARDRAPDRCALSSGFSSCALNSTVMPSSRCSDLTKLDDLLLMVRIEADQRLVEQQQSRSADQRLCQQQALPLAAGHFGERAAGQIARADQIEGAIDVGPLRLAQDRQAEAMAIRARSRRNPSRSAAGPGSRHGPAAYSRWRDCRASRPGRGRGCCRRSAAADREWRASASSCRSHSAPARRRMRRTECLG